MGVYHTFNKIKQAPFTNMSLIGKHNRVNFFLIPVTSDCIHKKEIISLLARWRKKNQQWFSSQFNVTLKGTRKWLSDRLINVPDRILFMIKVNEKYIGHVGLYRYGAMKKTIEIDNIIRGENMHPGIMHSAVSLMMKWGSDVVGISSYFLQTASDNARALRLYGKLGFKEIRRIPLVRVSRQGVKEWIEAPGNYSKMVKRYNIIMSTS